MPNDMPFIKKAKYVAVFMGSKKRTFEKIFEKPKTLYYEPWRRMLYKLNSHIENGANNGVKNVVRISYLYAFISVLFGQIWRVMLDYNT